MDKVKNSKKYILAVLALSVVTRLFAGVYEDSEFGEKYLFIKNRPAWNWYFHSPRGDSDRSLDSMSKAEQEEQLLYDEFVPNRLWELPVTIHR